PTGATLTFRPDFTIFEANEFDYDALAKRSRELAYCLPNLTITLRDERETAVRTEEYHFRNGLLDMIADLNRGHSVLHEPILEKNEWTIRVLGGSEYSIGVQIAFQYIEGFEYKLIGFANTLRTSGGTHMDALPPALAAAIKRQTGYLRLKKPFSF